MDTDMAPGSSMEQATQISMSSIGGMTLRQSHGLWWQLRPLISTWPLVLTQALAIDRDPSRTMHPDVALKDSLGSA